MTRIKSAPPPPRAAATQAPAPRQPAAPPPPSSAPAPQGWRPKQQTLNQQITAAANSLGRAVSTMVRGPARDVVVAPKAAAPSAGEATPLGSLKRSILERISNPYSVGITAGDIAPQTKQQVTERNTYIQKTLNLDVNQFQYMERARARDPGMSVDSAKKLAASSRTLTTADRTAIQDAQAALAAAKINPIPQGKNQIQIEIAFDGTGNDASVDATPTNPAQLHEAFAGEKTYVRGVGTNSEESTLGVIGKGIEGGTGEGMQNRIERGYAAVVAQVNEAKRLNPDAEVSIVVTGFSRGAATARQFVNVLNDRGIPNTDPNSKGPANFGAPRVGALVIFDTVDSHNTRVAAETIPPNVDNVLHLVSRDEHRPSFPLTTALDPNKPDPRVTEIALPGAHSDIGGGYPNAYTNISRDMALDYMEKAGVNLKPRTEPRASLNDPSYRLHDSTWTIKDTVLTGSTERRVVSPQGDPA